MSAVMPMWDDKQISRFKFRTALFSRRGMEPLRADALADKLATRDFERDDRRTCAECESLQHRGTCFQANQGRIRNASRNHAPVIDVLQRCDFFTFQKP